MDKIIDDYIDDEEREIFESLYAVEWQPNPDKNINKIFEEYARHSIELKNKIEIILTSNDVEKIKDKALIEGISYQELISKIIHSYNEGKITITA